MKALAVSLAALGSLLLSVAWYRQWRAQPSFRDLHALLASPDGPDLLGRGHRVTCPGDPHRRSTVLLPLLTRWAVTRQVQNDPAPHIGKARKGFRLHIADRRRRA